MADKKITPTENPNTLSGLFGDPAEKTEEKIAKELFNMNDLQTKTQLKNPLIWSTLQMIQMIFQKNNLQISNDRIDKWIENSMRNLISDERKGRSEFIQVISALSQKEKPVGSTPKWT
jgi:hypothetical protein